MSAFADVIGGGGVVLFPSDTVYGLACDPDNADAIARLYALKGRPPAKSSAVMFFSLEAVGGTLPELGTRTRAALLELMPGSITALLPNPERRYPLACAQDPGTLGLRVIDIPVLREVTLPVLQSSANRSGGRDPRELNNVPESIRSGVDLMIDGGKLPGVPSTVVDLRAYEQAGEWTIVREGAVSKQALSKALAPVAHRR